MRCPYCDSKTRVIDTRGIYRRRRCKECEETFSTYELTQHDILDVLDEELPDEIVDEVAEVLEHAFPTGTSRRYEFIK